MKNVEDLKERVTAAFADREKANEPFYAMAIRETLNLVDRGVLRVCATAISAARSGRCFGPVAGPYQ